MLLEKEFAEIDQLIDNDNIKNLKVSSKSIGWHLDHLLKVLINVSKLLNNSDSSDYKSNFNFMRFLIYTLGFIPRGKGKAPKSVLPTDDITKEYLAKQLEDAKLQIESIKTLKLKSNFKHPYFGILNLKQATKFLKLHTNHHLKICRDLIKHN